MSEALNVGDRVQDEMRAIRDALPDKPWPIPGSACVKCGAQLAWRDGVGRLVITHASGDDLCHRWSATMGAEDVSKAQAVLDVMEDVAVAAKAGVAAA